MVINTSGLKALARTKSFWTGLAAVVAGVFMLWPDLATEEQKKAAQTILGGLAVIFLRSAISGGGGGNTVDAVDAEESAGNGGDTNGQSK